MSPTSNEIFKESKGDKLFPPVLKKKPWKRPSIFSNTGAFT
jgi:hypothetical protein